MTHRSVVFAVVLACATTACSESANSTTAPVPIQRPNEATRPPTPLPMPAPVLPGPLPPPTSALVVESFTLFDFADPYAPAGSHGYMPVIRLREPTGVASASVVGFMAKMPTAPSVGWCTPVPIRTWAPGSSAEVLGLDRYFDEPEVWFGPYAQLPAGPVEVVLLVRDAAGVLGSITLSKTMTAADITTAVPRVMHESHLGCGN